MSGVIGFTGTRQGGTAAQLLTVTRLLEKWKARTTSVIHGDCVGADEQFDEIACSLGLHRHIRPCTAAPKLRANCGDKRPANASVYIATTAFARNREIVNGCDLLIAVPPCDEPQPKGGTFYTINYARKVKRRTIVVLRDGSLRHYSDVDQSGMPAHLRDDSER